MAGEGVPMEALKNLFFFFWKKRNISNSITWAMLLLSFFFGPLIYVFYAYLFLELSVIFYGLHKNWYDK